MIMSAANPAYADKQDAPRIRFESTSYDLGLIKEAGGPVTHEFVFYNEGNLPLIIVEATATCGCTRPEYPKKPIMPGKKGKIKVTYNPLGRPGAIDRSITVKTNGKPKKVTLKLLGNVKPK